MRRRGAAVSLACATLAGVLAVARSASLAQTPPPAADVPAQMTLGNGDGYRGEVLVTPQAPIPNQPQSATVTFDDGKERSGYVVPDGPGELTFGGWTLRATFRSGLADGPGTLAGPGGFHLDDGTFVHGTATSGTVAYGDGNTYSGGLRDGCFAGAGTFHAKNGAEATGTWAPISLGDGAPCTGTRLTAGRVTAAGMRFDGALDAAGKPDGSGRLTDRRGRTLSGAWSHGSYAGGFTQTEPSGWKDFHVVVARPSPTLDGAGTWYGMDGSRLYGQFHNGELAGPATLVAVSARRYTGNVSDGRFESSDRRYSASLDPYHDYAGARDALGRPNGPGTLGYYDSRHEHVTFVVSGTWRHGLMRGLMKAKTPGAGMPTFLVNVDPPGDVLTGRAKLLFPHKGYWQEGTFVAGALDGPGSVRFVNEPACRLAGYFHAGVMRSATKICAGDAPYEVEIASDGSIR